MRNGDLAADRRDVHDATAPSRTHLVRHGERRVERSPEVRRHRARVVIDLHVLDGTDLDDARVIDEHVDRSDFRFHAEQERGELFAVRDIARCREDESAARREVVFGASKLVGIARADRNSCPSIDELTREYETEPSRPARDHDDGATERQAAGTTAVLEDTRRQRTESSGTNQASNFCHDQLWSADDDRAPCMLNLGRRRRSHGGFLSRAREPLLPEVDGVPGVELEAGVDERPDVLEAELLVQRDARVVWQRDAGDGRPIAAQRDLAQ